MKRNENNIIIRNYKIDDKNEKQMKKTKYDVKSLSSFDINFY